MNTHRGYASNLACALFCALFLLAPGLARSQDDAPAANMSDWLQMRSEERTAAAKKAVQSAGMQLDRRSWVRQTEAGTTSANTNAIVDRSSATDFLSFAFNLSGLGGGLSDTSSADLDATSVTAVASGFAFWSLIQKANGRKDSPLESDFYCSKESKRARRLTFSAGYDNPDNATTQQLADPIIRAGVKYRIADGIDFCDTDKGLLKDVYKNLTEHAAAVAEQTEAFNALLIERFVRTGRFARLAGESDDDYEERFDEALGTSWPEIMSQLTEEDLAAIDAEIVSMSAEAERSLQASLEKVILPAQENWGVSATFDARIGDGTVDEYEAALQFDGSLDSRFNWALNAAVDVRHDSAGSTDAGGGIAGQLEYRIGPGSLDLGGAKGLLGAFAEGRAFEGRDPVTASLGAEAKWRKGEGPIYRAQFKLTVPAVDGIDIPISLSVANRTELIDSTDARVQMGFAFDTTRLLSAAQGLIR